MAGIACALSTAIVSFDMNRRSFALCSLGLLAAAAPVPSILAAPTGSTTDKLNAQAFHAARRHQTTSFGDIAYVERGKGPAALFLHGFPLNGFQWRGQLERLSPWRRCLAPDFLGLGYTRVRAGQSLAPAAQADMLAAFLDGLGERYVDIVANDSGVAVAQLFLVKYPDRVRSLLLTNGDTEINCPPPALLPVIEQAKAGAFAREWLAPDLADHDRARSKIGLGGQTFTYPERMEDATIDMYLGPLVANQTLTNGYAVALEANALAGTEAVLRQRGQPVRLIWGTGDPIFAAGASAYLNALFPNAMGIREVPGAMLFFPEEFPDLIAEEARRLWGIA